jgi:hypothetical protein
MINHCDRRITHIGDLDISFVLLNTFSKFLLQLECYLLSPERNIKINKYIKQTKRYISITKKSDTSITVIYHVMSLTVLNLKFAIFSTSLMSHDHIFLSLFQAQVHIKDNMTLEDYQFDYFFFIIDLTICRGKDFQNLTKFMNLITTS